MIVHSASLQGRRPTNEDEIEIVNGTRSSKGTPKDVVFCGVYDGHGGPGVSNFLKNKLKLARCFLQEPAPSLSGSKSYNSHVRRLYANIQATLASNVPKAKSAGSTALAGIAYKDRTGKHCLKVINLGDSRAVACNQHGIAVPLTKDHKPGSLEEHERIKQEGGRVTRAPYDDPRIGSLSVSRCFGDLDEKHVSQVPDVFDYSLKDKPFVILACDGVWDVMSNQDAVDVVRAALPTAVKRDTHKAGSTNVAQRLAEAAYRAGSADNLSVVVMMPKK